MIHWSGYMNIFTNFTWNHCIVVNLKYKRNTASYLLISIRVKHHNIFGEQTAHALHLFIGMIPMRILLNIISRLNL